MTRYIIAAVSMLLEGLLGQSTWIVDLDNRPGTNFTDLPQAVAAAAPGDVLLLRRPSASATAIYSAATIDKPLSVLGEFDGPATSLFETNTPAVSGQWLVQNIPAGGAVTIGSVHAQSLRATNVAGRLTLTNIKVTGGHVDVVDCEDVEIIACRIWGSLRSLSATRATLSVTRTEAYASWGSGMTLVDSDATLLRSCLRGGGGLTTFCTWSCTTSGNPPVPALQLDSMSRLACGPDSEIIASTNTYIPPLQPAITTYNTAVAGTGQLDLDPRALVLGQVDSGITTATRELPSTWTEAAFRFQSLTIGVDARPGDFVIVAASFRPATTLPTPFGELAVDPASAIVVGTGPLDATGSLELGLPVTIHLPLGSQLACQSAAIGNAGGIRLLRPAFTPILPPWQ